MPESDELWSPVRLTLLLATISTMLLLVIATLVTGYSIPLSTWSIALSLSSAGMTGVLFGTVPAKRAADLDPVRALHAE